jgi:hypothetical protein
LCFALIERRSVFVRFAFWGTCFLGGLLALPLSGAGLTFFAAAKKVSKESSFSSIGISRAMFKYH